MRTLTLLAALVFFILAAIIGFGNLDWRWQGVVSIGFACLAASFLPLERLK